MITFKGNTDNVSWQVNSNVVTFFSKKLPYAKYTFKVIAEVRAPDMKWIWVWENRHNILHRSQYPKGLKKRLNWEKDAEPVSMLMYKDPRVMTALHALKGEWYAYLVDTEVIHVIILTKLLWTSSQTDTRSG